MIRPYSTSEGFAAQDLRRVPLSVRWMLKLSNSLALGGWAFFGVGMIFVWIFVGAADLTFGRAFRGELETAPAEVVSATESSYSEDEVPIYRVAYRFMTPDEAWHEGVSYCLGPLPPGSKLVAEFPRGNPTVSRLRGMRAAPFDAWVLLVLIFPVIGIALAAAGYHRGSARARLLRTGVIARGRLIDKRPTNVHVGSRPVYRLTFEYTTADGGSFTCAERTHEPDRLEDEAEERLIYDPAVPSRSAMMDSLPCGVRLDEQTDELIAPPLGRRVVHLAVPLLAIATHGGILTWRLLH